MNLQDILLEKGTSVYTISPEATLADVVREMVDHNVGSMVVCQRDVNHGERLIGIVTERDLMRCFAKGPFDLTSIRVSEVMTRDPVTACPTDSVDDLMGVMTTRRIRHIPVLVEARLVGMVSIGDLLKAHHDHLAVENHFMREYIQS